MTAPHRVLALAALCGLLGLGGCTGSGGTITITLTPTATPTDPGLRVYEGFATATDRPGDGPTLARMKHTAEVRCTDTGCVLTSWYAGDGRTGPGPKKPLTIDVGRGTDGTYQAEIPAWGTA